MRRPAPGGHPPWAEDLRARMRDRLQVAIKNRETDAVRALRTTIAAIDNAEAPDPLPGSQAAGTVEMSPRGPGATEVPRRQLTELQVRGLLRREIDERVAAARSYEAAGRRARAAQLRAEVTVLKELGDGEGA